MGFACEFRARRRPRARFRRCLRPLARDRIEEGVKCVLTLVAACVIPRIASATLFDLALPEPDLEIDSLRSERRCLSPPGRTVGRDCGLRRSLKCASRRSMQCQDHSGTLPWRKRCICRHVQLKGATPYFIEAKYRSKVRLLSRSNHGITDSKVGPRTAAGAGRSSSCSTLRASTTGRNLRRKSNPAWSLDCNSMFDPISARTYRPTTFAQSLKPPPCAFCLQRPSVQSQSPSRQTETHPGRFSTSG
jgi:hypothetical protein